MLYDGYSYEPGKGQCAQFAYRIGYEFLKRRKMNCSQQERFREWNTRCTTSGSNLVLNQYMFKEIVQDDTICISTLSFTRSRRQCVPEPIECLIKILQYTNSVVLMSINYFSFPTDHDYNTGRPYFKPSNDKYISHAICCVAYEDDEFICIDSHAFGNVSKVSSDSSGITYPYSVCTKRISLSDIEIPSSLEYNDKIWIQSAVTVTVRC